MPQVNNNSELVLGLITTVGTDVESVITVVTEHLQKFNYSTEIISVSGEIISKFSDCVPQNDEYERIKYYMDLGNEIRERTKDSAILMRGVAATLYKKRHSLMSPEGPRSRIAYIIKSIKHPDEVEFLRDTYGDGFHLIGITSSYKRRMDHLIHRKGIQSTQAEELLERDANEAQGHGQHTQDAFQHSDYFIEVTDSNDQLRNSVYRLIDLLFGDPFITPSFDEYAMFMAYASSLRSADLSRQIGAVVANESNEILAMGANDCPCVNGGLYWPTRNTNGEYTDELDGRDYMLQYDDAQIGYDSNKIEQQHIIDNILNEFEIEKNKNNIERIKKAGIGDLTEYGRVVHAEMEAIISCARNNISCRGAFLYATTFPCHNCAKHIIAAGIKRVIYIEPYPKSKAFSFYKKEIKDGSVTDEMVNEVMFIPFTGVGPHRYIDLFAVSSTKWYSRKRKNKEGYKIAWERDKADLRNPMNVFTYLDIEKSAVLAFEEETCALKEEMSHGSKAKSDRI